MPYFLSKSLHKKLSRLKRFLLRQPPPPPTTGWAEIDHMGFRWKLCMDVYLDNSIARGHIWEQDSIELVNKLVKPGMCIIDVGANFGYYTLILSRLVGPQGLVIAFEPTEKYCSRLKGHMRENNIQNVHLNCLGLSDETKEMEIGIRDCTASLHYPPGTDLLSKETIKLVPLDEWWESYLVAGNPDRLDFIKVDLDGHEPNFLVGSKKVISQYKPYILIEFSQDSLFGSGYSTWELADELEELGYVLCNEKGGEPFKDRMALLRVAGNFAYSANVLARPQAD